MATAIERDIVTEPTTKSFRIAVLAGDGVGPEVMTEGLRVLHAVARHLRDVEFVCNAYSAGADEFLKSGDPLPPATLEACRESDAILLGAMGLPQVRWPDGREMTPQIDLREILDLYCGVRPIVLFHNSDSPLKSYQAGDIDFVIVRENTEGLFSDRLAVRDLDADEVQDVMRITRAGSERIIRRGLQLAQQRRRRIALVDKANVLPSMVYFRKIFDEQAAQYPEIEAERYYVDAAALYLIQRPESFDVIVTENMFGDILSDLAAGIVGGMGMAPSADIGDHHAVFQPSHGTAPDIAGQGKANPTAMILSVAMMLDWLGPEVANGSDLIRQAVRQVYAESSLRTVDLKGQATTHDIGDAVVDALESRL